MIVSRRARTDDGGRAARDASARDGGSSATGILSGAEIATLSEHSYDRLLRLKPREIGRGDRLTAEETAEVAHEVEAALVDENFSDDEEENDDDEESEEYSEGSGDDDTEEDEVAEAVAPPTSPTKKAAKPAVVAPLSVSAEAQKSMASAMESAANATIASASITDAAATPSSSSARKRKAPNSSETRKKNRAVAESTTDAVPVA